MEIIKDVLLTDCFLIKCYIETGGLRLSDYLGGRGRDYIPLKNVTMVDLQKGETIASPEGLVRKDEIILAHEFLDLTGDRNMKNILGRKVFSQTVDLYHTGGIGIEITGRIRSGAYEAMAKEKSFFVALDARVRGLDPSISPEFRLLDSLSYAIINRKQIGYIFKHHT